MLSDNENSETITSEEEMDKRLFETETKEGEDEEGQDELDQLGKASEDDVLAAMSLAGQEKKFSLPTPEELEQVLWDAADAHEESVDVREPLEAIIGAGQFKLSTNTHSNKRGEAPVGERPAQNVRPPGSPRSRNQEQL